MASFLTLPNFLSFLLPSTSPPAPPSKASPSHLTLSSQNPKISPSISVRDDGSSSNLSPELASVICPSLAYANTLFFKSGYNVQIIVEENESEERMLSRLRREVMKSGVLQEVKRRRYFESTQDKKKRKSREAAKRNRRRRNPGRPFQNRVEESSTEKKKDVDLDDDDDNWELPEGDLPF